MAFQYTCDACAFQIRSENDDEVIDLVRNHARDAHDMELTRGEIRDGWEEVSIAADD